uniref:Uncharacterized protein n=1 Tax=Astyanax mexicanus TaxID=7994 RepID=A0A8B9JWX8_ASTMX
MCKGCPLVVGQSKKKKKKKTLLKCRGGSRKDGLQFLSLEEKECILFFEETIDALEEGLEDEGTEQSSGRSTPVEDVRATSRPAVNSVPNTAIAPSLIEHDIIDLVHTTPNYSTPGNV